MKNRLLSLMMFLLIGLAGVAQPLTGTKTIGVQYPTLAAAIADLNLKGVGPGGVIFLLNAGYAETFNSSTDGLITASGTHSNKIVFKKVGSGVNPVITAPGSGTYDFVFAFGGADYITFDGIDVKDNTGSVEYGYAFFLASTTDGSQYDTIRNCNISLNKTNENSAGIFSRNWLYTNLGTQVILANVSGTNSYKGIYNNHISNVHSGVTLLGYASGPSQSYAYYDQGNDIGSLGGNVITNFGGGSNDIYGIYGYYQNNLIVANDSIYGTVTGTPSGIYGCTGILVSNANNATLNLYNNYVSIQYLGTGNAAFAAIFDQNSSGASISNTINIYNNTITGCTAPNSTMSNCNYLLIWDVGPNTNVHHNTIANNTYGSAGLPGTATLNYIYVSGYPPLEGLGIVNINNNTISNNERIQSVTGPGDNNYMWLTAQSNSISIYNNVVDNNISASTGTLYGIENHTHSATKYVYGNTITNIRNANGKANYGIYIIEGLDYWIYGNKIQNITANATNSVVTGILAGANDGGGNNYLYNNYVGDLKTPNSNDTVAVRGIYLSGYMTNLMGCYNNTVFLNATSTAANFGSAGLLVNEYPAIVELRNNIVVNLSTANGTSTNTAILNSRTNPNFPNLSSGSNNNCYYIGTPVGNNFIYTDGIKSDATLLLYKDRVYPKELLSVTEYPPFINSLTNPMDLHLGTSAFTQCESGGSIVTTPVAITRDYDDNSRFPNSGYPVNPSYPASAPDIGADEFAGKPLDLLAPIIS